MAKKDAQPIKAENKDEYKHANGEFFKLTRDGINFVVESVTVKDGIVIEQTATEPNVLDTAFDKVRRSILSGHFS